MIFFVARGHPWLMFSSLSTNTSWAFSGNLLPSQADMLPHSPDERKGLLHLWCRTQNLSLLNFVRFLLAHSSSMSRSFWMAALLTSMLTVPSAWSHLQISWVTNTLSPPPVIFKDIKQDRSQDRPLQCSTCFSCYWPLHKVWSIIHCLLGLTIQTICCLLNMTETCEPKYMDVLRVIVENLAAVY